ncbi:unnamed protein product [Medioppia subpectinata]|uniref:Uncharacterized protein n=1 Tax=Medioppia subpectinata TaxID=1979941 RepID=A0A7R9KIC1_9ACAR|nr:unnamed protein product [Medioppia subpectinata]CAG2102710.1 unnamed protein product [Medioppia subpectinata]
MANVTAEEQEIYANLYRDDLFADKVSDEFLCGICLAILRDPQLLPCDHMFCKQCVTTYFRSTPVSNCCPICRSRTTAADVRPAPRFVRNTIGKLIARCFNHSEGCTARMPLDQLDKHAATCRYRPCASSGGSQRSSGVGPTGTPLVIRVQLADRAKTVTLNATAEDTVLMLKRQIEDREGIDPKTLILTFGIIISIHNTIVLSVKIREPIAGRFDTNLIANGGTVETDEDIIEPKNRIVRQAPHVGSAPSSSPSPGVNSSPSGGQTTATTPVTSGQNQSTAFNTTIGSVTNETTVADTGAGVGSAGNGSVTQNSTAETQTVTEPTADPNQLTTKPSPVPTAQSTDGPSVWPVFVIALVFLCCVIFGLIWVLKSFCDINANEKLEESKINEAIIRAGNSGTDMNEKGSTGDHKKPPKEDKELTTTTTEEADKTDASKDSLGRVRHLKSPKSPAKQSAPDKSPVSGQDSSSAAPAKKGSSKSGSKTEVMMASERLLREYREFMSHPAPFGSVAPTDNLLVWTAFLNGPEGTPYEGGVFELELRFPHTYPTRGPQMTFKTQIFHANIQTNGHICVSLLSNWRPTDTVLTVLLALNNLLCEPNRSSAYTGVGLTEQQYEQTAREWTRLYAKKR